MPALAILDLDDPGVGIEADLAPDPLLDLRLRHGRLAQAADEGAIARMGLVESRLRRRTEQLGSAIKPIELDEDRARLLGAAPPHRRESALAVAAADIGCNPDRGFEAHEELTLRSARTQRQSAADRRL